MLSTLYPEFDWLPWKWNFGCPKNFWSDLKNQRKCLDWGEKELGIKEKSDWYKISVKVKKTNNYGILSFLSK